jgi:hypothetical protein
MRASRSEPYSNNLLFGCLKTKKDLQHVCSFLAKTSHVFYGDGSRKTHQVTQHKLAYQDSESYWY